MRFSNKALLASLAFSLLAPFAAGADDGCAKGYPPTLVKSFLSGCASKPEFKEFCECTIAKLQTSMPLYDFVEIGNAPDNALQKDARFTESTNACLDKVKGGATAE